MFGRRQKTSPDAWTAQSNQGVVASAPICCSRLKESYFAVCESVWKVRVSVHVISLRRDVHKSLVLSCTIIKGNLCTPVWQFLLLSLYDRESKWGKEGTHLWFLYCRILRLSSGVIMFGLCLRLFNRDAVTGDASTRKDKQISGILRLTLIYCWGSGQVLASNCDTLQNSDSLSRTLATALQASWFFM